MQDRRKSPDVSVSPPVILLLLVVFGLLVGIKIWAAGEASGVAAPNDLRRAPDGRLAVLHGRDLFLGDPAASDAERIDLRALGATRRLADFDFFPDGDILIWRNEEPQGWFADVLEGLRTAVGMEVGAANVSKAHLARCDLAVRSCEPFLQGAAAPRPPYGVAIAKDGTVYLADTAEHRILAFTESGERIGTFEDNLRYPNGLWLEDDRLWIANTEDAQLVAVSANPELGAETARHDYEHKRDTTDLRPTQLARVDAGWWIVSIGQRLTGVVVDRVDGDWQRRGSLPLGAGAEPTALLPLGDAVYVADAGRFRIARFGRDGTVRGELEWASLRSALAESRDARMSFAWTGHAAWTLFLALVVGGLLVGYRQGGRSAATIEGVPVTSLGIEIGDPRIQWIERSRTLPFGRRSLLLLTVALGLLGLALPIISGQWHGTALKLAAAMLVIAAFVWFGVGPLLDARIGVHDGWLILDNGHRTIAGRGDAIDYSNEGLAIGPVAVPLGRKGHRLFRQDDLDHHVAPLLERGTKISRSWMQLQILHSYPASAAAFGLLLVGTLAWLGYHGPFI